MQPSSTSPAGVEAGERPDPALREPTDAIVRVVPACVCGSDLCITSACENGGFYPATDLDGIADAYAAMDERRAIKSLVRVGSV